MKRISILSGLAVSLFALPAMAQETAYTTESVNIEAGPAPDYPSLGSFGPGTPVTLYGCLDGYVWCDVSYQDARGWVDGRALAYPYEDQRVPIAVYGPELSLPIVTFSFGDYWGRHYHDRPFFAERDRFERHAPPPPPPRREAPPPLPRRGEGRPAGEAPHPPERAPGPEGHPPVPHPEPAIRPEAHPEPGARPPEPHPQAVAPHPQPEARPVEQRPQAVAPHPQPEARPVEPRPQPAPAARPPEPHPQPAAHPPEEHREPAADQPHQ